MKKEVAGMAEETSFEQVYGRLSFNSQFFPRFSANDVGADSVKPSGASPAKGLFQLEL